MKKNRIIVIADEGEMTWESLILLEQRAEFYQMKSIQDALSNLTVFSYHLILIAVKRELEIVCQLVEAIRKLVITPMIVLLPDHSEMRNKIIYLGGRCGIDTTVYSGRSQSAVVCIDSPLYRMEIGKKRRNPCYGGKTENPSTSKNSRMGVYTYSQIYQLVWQEYPHGDITNIIYCMVHRLKQKLKKVDVNAEHIISSVKEVGYCLKVYKES